jgi:hypothetical protein
MSHRISRFSLFAAVLVLVPGCIEMTQTITLNPDGRGKVAQDLYIAAFDFDLGGGLQPGGKAKEKSLDEMIQQAAVSFLTKAKGVTAWKDVSVNWAPDGRLHLVGTAYFDRLEDLSSQDAKGPGLEAPSTSGMVSFFSSYKVTIENDEMRIEGKKNDQPLVKNQPPPDFSKLSDKEQDEFIQKQRIAFQMAKPMLAMFFTDLKIKTVLRVPGEIKKAKGFKTANVVEVSQTIDGNEFLNGMKKMMSMDTATLKKTLKGADPAELSKFFGMSGDEFEPSLTVAKGSKPLFDYDKEVAAARAAYPMLRKSLKLDADAKLPGEK